MIDLSDPLINLQDSLALLIASPRNFLNKIGYLGYAGNDLPEGFRRKRGDLTAVCRFFHRPLNQRRCFVRRLGTASRQVPNLFGDNRETFSVLPGTGGFYRGVQG